MILDRAVCDGIGARRVVLVLNYSRPIIRAYISIYSVRSAVKHQREIIKNNPISRITDDVLYDLCLLAPA